MCGSVKVIISAVGPNLMIINEAVVILVLCCLVVTGSRW